MDNRKTIDDEMLKSLIMRSRDLKEITYAL